MIVPDDSALLHKAAYDPVKAREYYLRTRHLKGRKAGVKVKPTSRGRPKAVKVKAKARKPSREELKAQKEALQKRLDHLRDVLAELVKSAKARSGVEDKSSDSSKEKASKNETPKKESKLTEKQKHEKAEKAREAYKKDHLSKDVKALEQKIKDIREKIESAIEDAKNKSSKSKPKTASKGR